MTLANTGQRKVANHSAERHGLRQALMRCLSTEQLVVTVNGARAGVAMHAGRLLHRCDVAPPPSGPYGKEILAVADGVVAMKIGRAHV